MATKKPRITITLTPHQHEIFTSLSDSSGQSMSGIIGEFLTASEPVFERMAAISVQIRKQRSTELELMRSNLDKAQAVLEPMAAIALDQFDMFLGSLETPQEPQNPRAVITGVTPPQPPTPHNSKKSAKASAGAAFNESLKK